MGEAQEGKGKSEEENAEKGERCQYEAYRVKNRVEGEISIKPLQSVQIPYVQ